jgi:acetylornithine/succinyldiaminopimelate/putrescine aminotransferase
VGEYFLAELRKLSARFPVITEVRGEGLMIGAQLSVPGAPVVAEAMKRGLLLNCTHETVLRFLPPYVISEDDVDHAIGILSSALATLPATP